MSNQRENPHRLYRDSSQAKLAGVCAGISEYLGLNRSGVRIATFFGAVFFPMVVILGYVLMALVLPRKPEETVVTTEQADFWREVSNAPADVFSRTRHRFRELELRLRRMEALVTSPEFEIDRELGRRPSGQRSQQDS
jgi:phage shock protein C